MPPAVGSVSGRAIKAWLWRLTEIRRSVWIEALSRDDNGDGTLGGMIASVDASVHSNPALFQEAISESSLHYEQPRELADSEDYPKLSRCFMDCDEFRLEGPLGEELDNAGMLIGKLCTEVDHGEVLEGVRTFAIRSMGQWRCCGIRVVGSFVRGRLELERISLWR